MRGREIVRIALAVLEAFEQDDLHTVLIEEVLADTGSDVEAAEIEIGGVVGDPHVVAEDAFVEGAAVDEGLLLRPRGPHEIAAPLVKVEHGRGDVVVLQEFHGAFGKLPGSDVELERVSAGDALAGDQHDDEREHVLDAETRRSEENAETFGR